MWNKQTESETPNTRPTHENTPPPMARPTAPTARNLSCLGAGLKIKGAISGSEDLQIDGKVEGPISLSGQKLTIGHTGDLNSDVTARDIIIHGDISGNLVAQDRVEIKKDAAVIGDIKASRISIEDGAYCKGRIEIERGGRQSTAVFTAPDPVNVTDLVAVGTN